LAHNSHGDPMKPIAARQRVGLCAKALASGEFIDRDLGKRLAAAQSLLGADIDDLHQALIEQAPRNFQGHAVEIDVPLLVGKSVV
jgi:hypothetical protein